MTSNLKNEKKEKSEMEKMRNFEEYYCDHPDLVKLRTRTALLYNEFNQTKETAEGIMRRKEIYQELFGKVGENLTITPPFYCDYGNYIYFGKKVYLNVNCVILDGADVIFGDFVMLGPSVHIYTVFHPWDAEERSKDTQIHKEVRIGNNVWIGGGAKILAGVTIGNNSVIGAGSVVTHSIPANVFACGVPCKVVRQIPNNPKSKL